MGHSEDDAVHKNLIKWKRIGRIRWKFQYWFDISSSMELDIRRKMLYLSNAPLRNAMNKVYIRNDVI